MPRSRSRFSQGRSSTRRQTSWVSAPSTGGTPGSPQTISASGTTLGSIGRTPAVEGLTIVRIRGSLILQLQIADVSASGFTGAFGIGIIQNEAFVTGGASSTPDSQDEPDSETWLYWKAFHVTTTTATTANIGADNSSILRIDVDSKAMRKFPGGETLYISLGVVESGTASMDWFFDGRVLVKLP